MATTNEQAAIEEKTVTEILVAGIRGKGTYNETGARLGKVARAAGRNIAGQPMGLYYDSEYKKHDADFESCFPIKAPIKKEGVDVHKLEGGRCISFKHVGPYQDLHHSYQLVFDYIREKKLVPKLPTREIYLKGPGMIFKGNPKKYITEIQVLVGD